MNIFHRFCVHRLYYSSYEINKQSVNIIYAHETKDTK